MSLLHRVLWFLLIAFLWIYMVVSLSGCYPNIKWARENNIPYNVEGLTEREILKRGYPVYGWAKYLGRIKGVHEIVIWEPWKDSEYLINHELCHARGLVCD